MVRGGGEEVKERGSLTAMRSSSTPHTESCQPQPPPLPPHSTLPYPALPCPACPPQPDTDPWVWPPPCSWGSEQSGLLSRLPTQLPAWPSLCLAQVTGSGSLVDELWTRRGLARLLVRLNCQARNIPLLLQLAPH